MVTLGALEGFDLVYAIDQLGPSGADVAPEVGVRLGELERRLVRSGRGAMLGPIPAAVGAIVTHRAFILV